MRRKADANSVQKLKRKWVWKRSKNAVLSSGSPANMNCTLLRSTRGSVKQ